MKKEISDVNKIYDEFKITKEIYVEQFNKINKLTTKNEKENKELRKKIIFNFFFFSIFFQTKIIFLQTKKIFFLLNKIHLAKNILKNINKKLIENYLKFN